MDSQALVRSLTLVTKLWTRQRKQEERDKRATQRRSDAMNRSRSITIAEAAYSAIHQ